MPNIPPMPFPYCRQTPPYGPEPWTDVPGRRRVPTPPVLSVNGRFPDANGNVVLDITNYLVSAVKSGSTVTILDNAGRTLSFEAEANVIESVTVNGAPVPVVGKTVRLSVPKVGSAKVLPKYLHELRFDDPYSADAEWFYETHADAAAGGCSAVRRGGWLYRNYDWTFDGSAEFVVRMSGSGGRFASVGMASVGSNLTEEMVTSGAWSHYYRCLPGMTLDGINENGVVCEINVDGGPRDGWHGSGPGSVHILGAVRWALDHGTDAAHVAAYLADNVRRPAGKHNFHFMVADAEKTFIVENGVAHDVTNSVKALTNFSVYDPAHEGGGKERYGLLADGAPLADLWFTQAYQPGNTWDSDFGTYDRHMSAIDQWASQGPDRESHRGKTSAGGEPWWQTVHSAKYDFEAKTMTVAVQETNDWYVFSTWQDRSSSGGGVRHEDFAGVDPDTVSLYDVVRILKGETDA